MGNHNRESHRLCVLKNVTEAGYLDLAEKQTVASARDNRRDWYENSWGKGRKVGCHSGLELNVSDSTVGELHDDTSDDDARDDGASALAAADE